MIEHITLHYYNFSSDEDAAKWETLRDEVSAKIQSAVPELKPTRVFSNMIRNTLFLGFRIGDNLHSAAITSCGSMTSGECAESLMELMQEAKKVA